MDSDRATQVAYGLNADLPGERQAQIEAEWRRMERETLTPGRMDERQVLLVGGAGYIGTELTAHLLERGYRVRATDLLLYGNGVSVAGFLRHPRYEFRRADLTDRAAMARALEGISDVVILAGLVGDPITKSYPEASDRINQEGMQSFIDLLDGRALNKVVFISTCSNYGLIPEGVLADEDYELKPLSRYATAKVAVEEHLMRHAPSADYHPTVLRFATAFGVSSRMRFDLTANEFTRDLYLGRELVVFDAHTWRPYCHVRDFATVMRRVLEAPVQLVAGEVFNAGGDVNNYTKQMIVDELLKLLPEARVSYQEQGSDPRNYRVDFAKVRDALLFEPEMTVAHGLAELLDALRQGVFDDVEANRRFYGNYEIEYPT